MSKSRLVSKWYVVWIGILALFAVACGAAEKPTAVPATAAPAQPPQAAVTQPTAAPQPPQQPAPAATAAPTAAPRPVAPAPQPVAGVIKDKPKVVLAAATVGQIAGDPTTQSYAQGVDPGQIGIRDYLFYNDGRDTMAGMLAKSWSMSPDQKKFIFPLREGIRFNTPNLADTQGMDFGEMTAEDVAWYINRHNPSVNTETIAGDGGQIASYFGRCTAVEKYVAECVAVNPSFFGLPLSMMIILDAGPSVESKKAFDTLGLTKVKDIAVGTGPFVQGEWIPNERGTIHAISDHWFKTAEISAFTLVQVPEVSTRIAMLQTNEVHLVQMDFSKVKELRSKGLDFLPTMQPNDTENASVIWPGNLWEEVHARTGQPLEPWKSPAYEKDYPWIGNPWGDKVAYQDTDNPPGMSDMEQARLVRWALSYAIDRQGIVDVLQSKLGTPIYIEYMGPLYPGWDPKRTVNKARNDAILQKHGCSLPVKQMSVDQCPSYNVASPTRADFPWPWEIPLDTKVAEKLLDEAGYPRKAGGIRFEISLNKYACETGDVCLEQADAVATGWESVGVKTTLLTEAYGPIVSQRMRLREQFWPVVKNCSVESANNPLDWPMPPADSSLTRPGWGCGFEDPFSALMQNRITFQPDKKTREEWHLDVTDWMYYWQLYSGVAQQPRGVGYNPKTISKWTSPSSQGPSWHRPEFIVPVK